MLDRHTARRLCELFAAQSFATCVREVARTSLVLDNAAELTCGRRLVEAEDLDRLARAGLLDLVAAEVVERAHLAPRVAGDDRIADVEGASVDQHCRDRATANVQTRLDDRTGSLGARVRGELELGVGDEENLFEQVVEVLALLRGHIGELCGAAPLLRL